MWKIKWLASVINRKLMLSFFIIFSIYIVCDTGILILPMMYAQILNTVELTRQFPRTQFLSLVCLTILFLSVRLFATFLNSLQKLSIHKNISLYAIDRLFGLSPSELSEKGTGYYTTLILKRSEEISSLFDIKSMTGIINLLRLVVITVIIFYIDRIVGFLSIVLVFISVYIYRYGNKRFIEKYNPLVKKRMQYFSDVEDSFSNRDEIILLNAVSYEEKRKYSFTEILKKVTTEALSLNFAYFFIKLDFVRIFYELFVFAWSLRMVYRGVYPIGTGIVLISYASMMGKPIAYLNSVLSGIQRGLNAIDIVSEIDRKNTEKDIQLRHITEISFKNVSYEIKGKRILTDLSFKIYKGEKVRIYGPSGKGKSTVVSLILKDVLPSSGEITINRININFISKEWLHKYITVLSQDSELFPGTIEENIRLNQENRLGISLKEILRMVKIKFPLDYRIEEDLSNLSRGEKERILLARFLYHSSEFVILDEPLGGVDKDTKGEILLNLRKFLVNKTVIIITHNKETGNLLADRRIYI